ncbi:unnamed protein product [Urochloa decumbens]|uniref:Pierisin-like domain-containing protein n=1 Tax=Urochloa decumbens TaxID=240449 RepID=A0ABC9G9Q2_9POAL
MSFIPHDSPLRGCAAAFPQPVTANDSSAARSLVQAVSQHNGVVIYRSSNREEHDLTHHVFRWNTIDYRHVFENGFQARPQGDTPNGTYYDLDHYVHQAGSPLDQTRPVNHVFISTTLNSGWRPTPSTTILPQGAELEVYRYEIYAPGGIWVRQTLGNRYRYPAQDEVAFVRGIAPQYIRSAQLFIVTRGRDNPRYLSWRRADRTIRVNLRFNPQSHPRRMHTIRRPIFDYRDENGNCPPLTITIWRGQLPQQDRREKRDADSDSISEWYAGSVADSASYINAAFRSSRTNEAYLFMQNEYVLVNYAPGGRGDRIVHGPLLICDGFPSLSGTAFGEYGIDCAFNSKFGNEAFIFSGNLCAHIDYAPGTKKVTILNGPMTITTMFPFFNGTVFADSIDAAFTSTVLHKAYLFKDDSYALINYNSKTCEAIRKIRDGFNGLRDTMFESGIEAAFASHRTDEAYIFKGDKYALINFAPGSTKDHIIGGVKPITPNWPSLRGILPRKNRGLDDHDHHNQAQAHPAHDEL